MLSGYIYILKANNVKGWGVLFLSSGIVGGRLLKELRGIFWDRVSYSSYLYQVGLGEVLKN